MAWEWGCPQSRQPVQQLSALGDAPFSPIHSYVTNFKFIIPEE